MVRKTMLREAASHGALARWGIFNLVGVLGAALQLTLLTLLTGALRFDLLPATLLAVEITLLHNFLLHERWTWRDCSAVGFRCRLTRLARFQLCNGLVSLLGNAAVIQLFVVQLGWPVAVSGLIAILSCSVLNFFLSHQLVFRTLQSSSR